MLFLNTRLKQSQESSLNSQVIFSYKNYFNTATRTVNKYGATLLSYYHINIKLTLSHVKSVNTQLQYCHVILYIYIYIIKTVTRTDSKHTATFLSCNRTNNTLQVSHVTSVNTQL